MLVSVFRPELPSAVVGVISLIVVVAVLDAGVANRWVRRRRSRQADERITKRTYAYAYVVGFGTLGTGLAALALGLCALWARTNRFDLLLLVLAAVPVLGLSFHFGSRLHEEIQRLGRADDPPEDRHVRC